MTTRTLEEWKTMIDEAIRTDDYTLSNLRITRVHLLLSQALLDAIGHEAGANFHSWAVWGSRKAGVTVRQEDRDQASRDGTIVAGIVGTLVGLAVGFGLHGTMQWSLPSAMTAWAVTGAIAGGFSGFLLAGYTRSRAAKLILHGNRIVLEDIGLVSARYLDYVAQIGPPTNENADQTLDAIDRSEQQSAFATFIHSLRPAPTENDGQDLLKQAFSAYEMARCSRVEKVQHEANFFANCLAVLHEHIRLQPIIRDSLPFLISKCVTQRLMTYSVGERQLAVHDDVPPLGDEPFPKTLQEIDLPELREFLNGDEGYDVQRDGLLNTRANDWTILRERMRYIVNLFRTQHLSAEVMRSPYDEDQLRDIANGTRPKRPW
ncbi:hypothetical protein [Rubripirellula reticaptiva]|uniref:Uncharacterized protein n=1 Tax=Rubripirellula reticaptiva TaxID=2528013 RepID=A0A5C6ETR6_9BACT|nr:hypothetical protein [Rubripirellula reticaptiva]TWU51700.1 hypothetical protein Poly59_32950 [Rubripirellula reticaptiva]